MARQLIILNAATILVTMMFTGASAQSGNCGNAIASLSPCLNYISGNSSTPSISCCSQLGTVIQSEPQCLCTVLNGGASSLGINVNMTQALALPGVCNLRTPPISQCNGPTGSPSASGGGSNISPSPSSSNGRSVQAPVSLLFSLLIIMSYLWTFPSGF